MKLPRKTKKKLITKLGRETVQKIISGQLIYKAKISIGMTENGWKKNYGAKTIFFKIN